MSSVKIEKGSSIYEEEGIFPHFLGKLQNVCV